MKTTAILTTGIIIIKDKKVLLVKHKKQAIHLTNIYGIPGGRVENNENIIDACLRETKEETGLIIDRKNLIRLSKVYIADIKRKDGINTFAGIIFTTRKFKGQLESLNETTPEWIEISKLENLDLIPNVKEMIKDTLKLF